MISFNILGDCVSRDILTSVSEIFGGVKVQQYHALSNPISIFGQKGNMEIVLEDFQGKNKTLSNFRKRCMIQDMNKTVLNYVFEKKSDYFILDILDARFSLMRKDEHYFTKDPKINLKEMSDRLEPNAYQKISPFTDIDMEQWKLCIDKLTSVIQKYYRPNQIILNVHYGVKKYTNGLLIQNFKSSTARFADTYNPLVHKLFEMLICNLEGCHIIEFPENIIASTEHWLGLHPLHYHKMYYDYAAEAINVIMCNMPDYDEKKKLNQLKKLCSEQFEAMQAKMELDAIKRNLRRRNNVLAFANALSLDFYGNGNFTHWLESNQGKKVAVLKCQDLAAQILLKGLNKYGFDIVFSTQSASFDKLTEEQMSLCKEADIIISANVHSSIAPQRDGIKAICISDLLKNESDMKINSIV